jgi:hypothetical protein
LSHRLAKVAALAAEGPLVFLVEVEVQPAFLEAAEVQRPAFLLFRRFLCRLSLYR